VIVKEIEERYSIMYLILSAPNEKRNRITILLARPTGDVKFKGLALLKDDIIHFSLKSVRRPGNLPLSAEGDINITKSNLTIKTAKFSRLIYNKEVTQSEKRV
jgi:hypothetical protein